MFWSSVNKEELKQIYIVEGLSDQEISNKYSVPISKVRYKRKKFGITYRAKSTFQLFNTDNKYKKRIDMEAFDLLDNCDNIDLYSKALTNYLFRSGPVEDMHCKGQLSQDDMKILNKYIVNRTATLLTLIFNDEWFKIYLAFQYHKHFGTDWDPAEIDYGEFDIPLDFWDKCKPFE